MSNATARRFASGKPMPKNLYHWNKEKFRDVKFRFRLPNGRFKPMTGSEDQVTKWAKEAQQIIESGKYSSEELTELFTPKKSTAKPSAKKTLCDVFDKFAVDFIQEYPSKIKSSKWNQSVSGARSLLLNNFQIEAAKADRKFWKQTWLDMAQKNKSAQKNYRHVLRAFVVYLIDHEIVDMTPNNNPFLSPESGGLKFSEFEAKERQPMTLTVFKKAVGIAESKGYYFLQDALEIAMLTFMRVDDVISLRFDEHINGNVLEKVISKSTGRKTTVAVKHCYDLSVHTDLAKVIARSKARADEYTTCPYIIHHNYSAIRKSAKKDHPHQVLKDFLPKALKEVMDEIEEVKFLNGRQRPTFHEIRALRKSLDDLKRDSKSISIDMGHADEKVTNQYYDTHREAKPVEISYAFNLDEIKD